MKEITIVLNTLEGKNGEILERSRTHIIRKKADGFMEGEFVNTSVEDSAIKLTFTGLKSMALFQLTTIGREQNKMVEEKKANSAGILEFKTIIPPFGKAMLMEL